MKQWTGAAAIAMSCLAIGLNLGMEVSRQRTQSLEALLHLTEESLQDERCQGLVLHCLMEHPEERHAWDGGRCAREAMCQGMKP